MAWAQSAPEGLRLSCMRAGWRSVVCWMRRFARCVFVFVLLL
ncbi:MAG: hypothetical protein ACYCXW_12270 [Solirubrobacteraceae bacterium]